MKLKITKQRSKGNIVFKVMIGLFAITLGVLTFPLKNGAIGNYLLSAFLFLGGLLMVIVTITTRKKSEEIVINNVINFQEEK